MNRDDVAVAADEPAEEALQRVLRAIPAGRLNEVWRALPASYQRDINELARLAARKIDQSLWTASGAALSQLAGTMRAQKERFLSSPSFVLPGTREAGKELRDAWDQLADTLEKLAYSELGDPAALESFDGETFTQRVGPLLAETWSAWNRLPGVPQPLSDRVEVRRSQVDPHPPDRHPPDSSQVVGGNRERAQNEIGTVLGELAAVEIHVPGRPVQTALLVRVEGKWIPRWLAAGWMNGVTHTRQQLGEETAAATREQQARATEWATQLTSRLKKCEQGATQADFDRNWFNVLLHFSMLPKVLAPQIVRPASIELRIRGEMNAQIETVLLQKLLNSHSDQKPVEYTALREGGELVIFISNRQDIEALARGLTFLDDVQVDTTGRKISATWSAPSR